MQFVKLTREEVYVANLLLFLEMCILDFLVGHYKPCHSVTRAHVYVYRSSCFHRLALNIEYILCDKYS